MGRFGGRAWALGMTAVGIATALGGRGRDRSGSLSIRRIVSGVITALLGAVRPSRPGVARPKPTSQPGTTATPTFRYPSGTDLPERPPPSEPVATGGTTATRLEATVGCDRANADAGRGNAIVGGRVEWRQADSLGSRPASMASRPASTLCPQRCPPDSRPRTSSAEHRLAGRTDWQVLTRSGDHWAASQVQSFSGPTCIGD